MKINNYGKSNYLLVMVIAMVQGIGAARSGREKWTQGFCAVNK